MKRRIGYGSFMFWTAVVTFTAVLAWLIHHGGIAVALKAQIGSTTQPPSIQVRLVDGPNITKGGDTAETAKYLGSGACQVCHPAQHQGYLETLHSKSFRDLGDAVVLKQTEWQGAFLSPDRARNYKAVQREQGLVHQEWGNVQAEPPLLIAEKSIGFAVGSGDHATSFLLRDGPFWLQSPITKYRENFGYSPGFQFQPNLSFSRKITASCAFCHVGQIVRDEPLHPYRFQVVEQSIGCERCHGPGERHVQARQNKAAVLADEFIVQPAKLERELAEAICQQCHLQGDAKVNPLGKDDWDFRRDKG